MKILVIGSGGREHALIWKIRQSPLAQKIYCAPGNGGISAIAECVAIAADNVPALLEFARREKIGLTVVGPEVALVAGIVDAFVAAGLKIFGPSQAAARLEGSKIFAKEFMRDNHIPTALFRTFNEPTAARQFLERCDYPIVVKADGLAAGKGVVICADKKAAEQAIDDMMGKKIFNEAGQRVVIEQCLQGEEVSLLAICDGSAALLLDSAQDHKRIFDDDLGPNTGGMGAYSPAPMASGRMIKEIEARVIEPTLRGMRQRGLTFRGILYAGIMITVDGPMVLEYNVRFGDPETQAVLPRMKSDLVDLMLAACEGRLAGKKIEWDPRASVCVVMSAAGYPGKYPTGMTITGLDAAQENPHTVVFHAGTKMADGHIVASGGRVLGVTGLGQGLEAAMDQAYRSVEKIKFEHCFFRRDIGAKAVGRL
ncbi:MAG: phosphoribosylamine--glycine ligase [Candidatus Omnitrophica bacterium]|nr:phosphoribosylamine--glycine ligase [Candidatus Omnitrophota bacterium]